MARVMAQLLYGDQTLVDPAVIERFIGAFPDLRAGGATLRLGAHVVRRVEEPTVIARLALELTQRG